MKKFKILTRRLARGPSSAASDLDSGPPTRESSPDVHQLPSRRQRNGGDVRRRRRQVQQQQSWRSVAEEHDEAAGRFLVDEDRVCENCAAIDFPKLLDWSPGNPRPWVSLAHSLANVRDEAVVNEEREDSVESVNEPPEHISAEERSTATEEASESVSISTEQTPPPLCAYCAFFRTMVGSAVPQDGSGNFTPYLRIRQAFERLGVREKHELGRAVLIEVMTRNRALPWGYLVRAADDETDIEGYRSRAPRLRGRTVPALLDPEVPRTWIDFCTKHHEDEGCDLGLPVVPGLRLVDCETRRCVAAEELDLEERLQYVALSYVWGGRPDEYFDNYDRLSDDLPLLFTDAISFTRSLGFRYIWIDRYCFPHSGDAAKRQQHLDLVGDIYARSALTLVIAAGNSALDGIPGVSLPREEQLSLKTPAGLFTTTLLRPDIDVASSTWATRAWTFQEGLLARRRLVLTPSQAYFQCRVLHCAESVCVSLHLAPALNLGRVFPVEGAGAGPGDLARQIRAYMPRELSLAADRLDAFRGILRTYADIPRAVDNLLGLPLFDPDDFTGEGVVSQTDRLALGLGWMSGGAGGGGDGDDPYELCGPFPSWTWVAWGARPGSCVPKRSFHFHLVGETSPIADGVRAAPGMEVSLGFGDGMVLSWEIDGDAIARKGENAAFLRLTTFCFDIPVRRVVAEENGDADPDTPPPSSPPPPSPVQIDAPLNAAARDAIALWVTHATSSQPVGDTSTSTSRPITPITPDCPDLTGVLISGRGWKDASLGSGVGGVATVLVCGPRGLQPDGQLVRFGALGVAFDGFVRTNEEDALVKGVETTAAAEKKDLLVRLREVDIY